MGGCCRLGTTAPAILLFLLPLFASVFGQTCYLPDGTVANDDIPCGDAIPGKCCAGPAGVCLSNGLCFSPSNSLVSRSSCTDQSWESNDCTTYCSDVDKGIYVALTACPDGSFCCNISPEANECCLNGKGFTVSESNFIVNLDLAAQSGLALSASVVTETIVSRSVSTEVSRSGATITSNGNPNGGVVSTVCTSTTTATLLGNGQILTPVSTSSADCTSKEVAVGAGVGVPLFVICLLLLALLIWQMRRRKKAESHRYSAVAGGPMPEKPATAAPKPPAAAAYQQQHSPPAPSPPPQHHPQHQQSQEFSVVSAGYGSTPTAYDSRQELGRSDTRYEAPGAYPSQGSFQPQGGYQPQYELGQNSPAPQHNTMYTGQPAEMPASKPWYQGQY